MATHSSILACRILWTEEPGGLQSMGSQIVGHDWSILPRMHTSVMPSPPSRSEPYLSPPKVSFYPLFIDYYYFVVRTLKIYPPSRFLAHNTALLTIGIVLYIRLWNYLSYITDTLYHLTIIYHFLLLTASGSHHFILWFYEFILDCTYNWDHAVFSFLCLVYFTQHNALQIYSCCHKFSPSF